MLGFLICKICSFSNLAMPKKYKSTSIESTLPLVSGYFTHSGIWDPNMSFLASKSDQNWHQNLTHFWHPILASKFVISGIRIPTSQFWQISSDFIKIGQFGVILEQSVLSQIPKKPWWTIGVSKFSRQKWSKFRSGNFRKSRFFHFFSFFLHFFWKFCISDTFLASKLASKWHQNLTHFWHISDTFLTSNLASGSGTPNSANSGNLIKSGIWNPNLDIQSGIRNLAIWHISDTSGIPI